jgi:hypothetical protein
VQEAAKTERLVKIHENFGIAKRPWTATEFAALQKEIGPKWIALAKELGITLD